MPYLRSISAISGKNQPLSGFEECKLSPKCILDNGVRIGFLGISSHNSIHTPH